MNVNPSKSDEPRQAQAQASEAELCHLRSLWGCLADPVSGRC